MIPIPARLAPPSSLCLIVSIIGPGEKLFFLLIDPSMPSRPSDSDPPAAPARPDPAVPGAPRPSFFRIFFSIMLPMFLAVVDQTIVSTALPAIAGSMGGVERISWIVGGDVVAGTTDEPVNKTEGRPLGEGGDTK